MKQFLLGTVVTMAVTTGVAYADIQLNTGTDSNGAVLSAGSLDPFWTISTDGVDFDAARVAYPGSYPDYSSGQTCCGMETVPGTAAWVTTPGVVATSPTTGWGMGTLVYLRRTFDLSDYDIDTVALAGKFRVADAARGIYINGQLVAGTDYGGGYTFSADLSFSVGAGTGVFVDGVNTIEMRGYSVNNVWDAFWLETGVTGEMAPVPEPGTWVLLGAGLGMLALGRRGKRRT